MAAGARRQDETTNLQAQDEKCTVLGRQLVAESKQSLIDILSACKAGPFGSPSEVDVEYAERFSRLLECSLEGNELAFAAVANRWKDGVSFEDLIETHTLSHTAAAQLAAEPMATPQTDSSLSLLGATDPVQSKVLLCYASRLQPLAAEYVAVVRYDPSPREEQLGLQPLWFTYTADTDGLGLGLLRWVVMAMNDSRAASEHLPLRWQLCDINFAARGAPEASEMLGLTKPILDELIPAVALFAGVVAIVYSQRSPSPAASARKVSK